MSDLKESFARARQILAEDPNPTTFTEKLSLYRMARTGFIVWRNKVDNSLAGIQIQVGP